MARYFSTVLLSVMLIGLLFIYLITPPASQNVVGIISVLLLAMGLFLGYAGDPLQRESSLQMLGAMTGIISVLSAGLVGYTLFRNAVGAVCLPMLLLLAVTGGFLLYVRRANHVEEGDVMVVDRRVGGGNYVLPPGIYRPLMPGVEEAFAVMPSYELTATVEVAQPDTHLLFKPDVISLFLRYRIRELSSAEREELEQLYEAALQRARAAGQPRSVVLEQLIKQQVEQARQVQPTQRRDWERHLVGDAPFSQEELADRRHILEEQMIDEIEAVQEAWDLFVQPFASYLRLAYHFPNRDVALAELARDWGEELETSRLRSEFWTELIRRQITEELDEVVRETVHDARGLVVRDGQALFNDDGTPRWAYYGPVEVSERRDDLTDVIRRRLQQRVRRWGIQILHMDIEQVKLTQQSIEFKYRPVFESVKTQQAMEEARREAERIRITGEAEVEYETQHLRTRARAEAEALAEMIDLLSKEISRTGVDLSEIDIRRIVFEVLEEQKRLQYRVASPRPGKSGG